MIPTIDKMLSLTADIAEELLILKDADKDMLPADLKLKIIQLAELAATSETEEPQPVEEVNTDVPEAETVEETASDIVESAEVEAIEDFAEPMPEPVSEPVLEPVSELALEPEPEPVDKSEPEVESVPEPEPEPIPSELEAGFAALEAAIENAKEPESVEAKTAVQEEPNVEAVEPESAAPERFIEIGALQKAFSINDLFFFRREIFGGSKQSFDAMLDRVSALSDRRMLQEYLVEELNLNLNQTPGKDLYHILVTFFR
jgi:hypothetical protein